MWLSVCMLKLCYLESIDPLVKNVIIYSIVTKSHIFQNDIRSCTPELPCLFLQDLNLICPPSQGEVRLLV